MGGIARLQQHRFVVAHAAVFLPLSGLLPNLQRTVDCDAFVGASSFFPQEGLHDKCNPAIVVPKLALPSAGTQVVQVSPILENDLLLKRAVSGHWPSGVSIVSFMVDSSHHRRPITARMSCSAITATRESSMILLFYDRTLLRRPGQTLVSSMKAASAHPGFGKKGFWNDRHELCLAKSR